MGLLKRLIHRNKESKDNDPDGINGPYNTYEPSHNPEAQKNHTCERARSEPSKSQPNIEGSKAQRSSPQDLWQSAYDQLGEKEQKILAKPEPPAQSGSDGKDRETRKVIEEVIQTTKEQYEYYQERGLKIRRSKGDDIDLRKLSHTIINAAISFKTVIGAGAACDPTSHAASAWAVVSLGLTIAKNRSDLRDAFFDSSEYLADNLARYAYIEENFYHQPGNDGQVGQALVKVYKAVLQYTAEVLALKNVGKGKWILDSVTEIADQPLTTLKASIKEQEQDLNCRIAREQYLHQNAQAEKLLLQGDQMIRSLQILIERFNLPIAEGAPYDSYDNQHVDRCLPETRTEIRGQVAEWAADFHSKLIFWLNGMAGTGKSTIAYTLAQFFKEKGALGASFFFKRGEPDRSNARRFISTIAKQLMTSHREIASDIIKAIEHDSDLATKDIVQQFDRLLLRPLLNLKSNEINPVVIVIDALDECENEEEISLILGLLPKLEKSTSLPLRIFITSRPELPIRQGFEQNHHYQDRILHELPRPVIEHDIRLFLENKFSKIKAKRKIREDWPTYDTMETLVKLAVPLFIFAATVCRFVGEGIHPEKRLKKYLDFQEATSASQMDKMYQPVLGQLLPSDGKDAPLEYLEELEELLEEFRNTVGVIVLLVYPLSIETLAKLLDLRPKAITDLLGPLHSVLSIPREANAPVRLLHLSFKDYLLNTDSKFHVEEKETHWKIVLDCFRVMRYRLKRNICGLSSYGTLRADVPSETLTKSLPEELQYCCRYWVYHLKGSSHRSAAEEVLTFLKVHFLHWLESMSLIGALSDALNLVTQVQACVQSNVSDELSSFLHEARRFLLKNVQIINTAPLQLYCSCVAFSPMKSVIRTLFQSDRSELISILPRVQVSWGADQKIFEGHTDAIRCVAFSSNGQRIASGSEDGTVKFWDIPTGLEARSFEMFSAIGSLAFSPDEKKMAVGSYDGVIRLWDTTTDSVQILEGHSDLVSSINFSVDSRKLVSASRDRCIKLWDTMTRQETHNLDCHSRLKFAAISPDMRTVAALTEVNSTNNINFWDISTALEIQKPKGFSDNIYSTVFFSPDWQCVAAGSIDGYTALWDLISGLQLLKVKSHIKRVSFVALSSDKKQLASADNWSGFVKIWDVTTGSEMYSLQGHSMFILSLAFSPSPDDRKLAAGSADGTLKIWDIPNSFKLETNCPMSHVSSVQVQVFSPCGQRRASGFVDMSIRIYDIVTGLQIQTLKGHTEAIESIAFSPDAQRIVSSSQGGTIKLWDTITGLEIQSLQGHRKPVSSIIFFPGGRKVVWVSRDGTVKLWDPTTSTLMQSLEGGPRTTIICVAASFNGKRIASGNSDGTVNVWNTTAGSEILTAQVLKGHSAQVGSVDFSPDGQKVVSGDNDGYVKLWDATSASEIQGHCYDTRIRTVILSPDAKTVAILCNDGDVKLWDIPSDPNRENPGKVIHSGSPKESSLSSFGPSPKRGFVISIEDGWIALKGEKVVWLPPEYREPIRLAMKNDTISLGYRDGSDFLIGFCIPAS